MRLDHAKFPTVYFLVEQLYHNFQLPLNTLDHSTLIDLMILSQKFQIQKLQVLCETNIEVTVETFPRLYDYYRNSILPSFKDQIIKAFVIHSQELIKTMPIGKIEELIRIVYSPDCPHTSITEFKTKINCNYFVKQVDSHEFVEHSKTINFGGFLKNE